MRLRTHLLLLVVATLLPALIFAAVMVVSFSRQQIVAQEENLVDTARSYSSNIDRELTSEIRSLQGLATSKNLDLGNLTQFYEEATRFQKALSAWEAVVLTDPSGQQLVNIKLPSGSPLPHGDVPDMLKQIVETNRPTVSNLFFGPVAKRPVVAVGVPVVRDGKLKYVLTAKTSPGPLMEILSQGNIPSGWLVAVLDKNKFIIARNRDHDKFLGQPAGARLAAQTREAVAGLFEGTTLHGTSVATGFHRSELSGWTVAVEIPLSVFHTPVRRSLTIIGFGGILFLLAGILLAIILGRRIIFPLAALSASMDAFAHGKTDSSVRSSIVEIDDVAHALEYAAVARTQAERSLRENEERLRLAVEGGSIGTWHRNLSSGEIIWSDRCREIFGVAPNAPLSHEMFLDAIDPKDRDYVRDAHADAFRQRKQYDLQYRIVRPDGSSRWVSAIGRGSYDDAGNLIRIEGVVLDVTEQKMAAEYLLAAENRYRALIEHSPDGIGLISANGKVLYLSPATTRMTGYPLDERLGKFYVDIVHADDQLTVHETFSAVLQKPSASETLQFRYRHKDGSWRWIESVLTNMLDEPSVRAIVCNQRDITERKLAERDLQARVDELQWLHQISQRIFQSDELKTTAQIILDAASLVSSCDLGIIRLMDKTTGLLEPVASQGYKDPESPNQHRKIVENGTTDSLVQTVNLKHTLVQERLQDKPGLQNFKNEGIQSLITVPVRTDNHVLGILQLGNRTVRTFEPDLINLLETLGCNLGIAVQMNNHLDDALASQTQLRNLARKLVEAQETERRHIARELHDEVGQELTALKLSLGLAARSETSHEKSRLDDAADLIDKLVAKVRDISVRFRPAMLDDLGLLPTLLWYFKSFTEQTNIQVNFEHTLDRRFSTELETNAYRIVQESLTNAARHAKVSETSVHISANRQLFRIEIEDQGAGFDPITATQETAGLTEMRERAAAVGGHLTVLSAAGAGTLVAAEFPLEEERSDFTESRSTDG